MQIRSMEIPKRRPNLVLVLVEAHLGKAVALPADHVALARASRVFGEGGLHAPCCEHARAVGQALDAGAYFANLGGGFEDVDGVAGEEDGDCGAEAAEACADYYDLWVLLSWRWGQGNC